jgi:hypothetical protein
LNTNKLRSATSVALAAISLAAIAPISAAFAQAPVATPVHKNWIHRHPTATSLAAAMATHHALKVAAARDKASGKKLNWAEKHPSMSAVGVGAVAHHEIMKTEPK